jgi:hypothetical protein
MASPFAEKLSRRRLFKYGAAGLVGLGLYKGAQVVANPRGLPTGGGPADEFEVNPKYRGLTENLGRYIYLTPQKLGGGSHAVDLETQKTLAWISYWNYGDTCPISHHLAAYPGDDGDPYKGFEFVNSTQGGENVLMYGIPTRIKELGLLDPIHGQGNQLYRVRYDGKSGQMELMENIAETTGVGLGVHCVIFPDGTGFGCADGQKDVAAFFNRAVGPTQKTRVLAAFRCDWFPNSEFLGEAWLKGGRARLTRLVPSKEEAGGLHDPDGYYDYRGTNGNKIHYEMAPMAELLVERGQVPGDSPNTLSGLDFNLHDPRNRFSVLGCRMLGGGWVVDRTTFEPVCFLQANEGSQGNYPIAKLSNNPEVWEVTLPAVGNPIHESGFNPSGNHFCMMNNLRANNVAVFDTTDPDPRKWARQTFVKDPDWSGEYPSPFHINFSIDGSKCFLTVLRPKPMKSDLFVVSTKDWKVIKKFRNIGVDTQTTATTYDGKYVLAIFSGFQRMESGAFAFRQDTLEEVGYMPNFGGHHDCVIVPSTVEQLKFSRSCTV